MLFWGYVSLFFKNDLADGIRQLLQTLTLLDPPIIATYIDRVLQNNLIMLEAFSHSFRHMDGTKGIRHCLQKYACC